MAPLGGPEYVAALLHQLRAKQDSLLQAIRTIPVLQCAWLLLFLRASPRFGRVLRMLPPCLNAAFGAPRTTRLCHLVCSISLVWPNFKKIGQLRGSSSLAMDRGDADRGLSPVSSPCFQLHQCVPHMHVRIRLRRKRAAGELRMAILRAHLAPYASECAPLAMPVLPIRPVKICRKKRFAEENLVNACIVNGVAILEAAPAYDIRAVSSPEGLPPEWAGFAVTMLPS